MEESPVEVYTLKQTCELLGKFPSQIARYVKQGKLHRIVPDPDDNRGFYLKADVDALAEKQRNVRKKIKIVAL